MAVSKKVRGYFLGVVAAASYGLNPLFALPLYAHGMDAGSVLFFRYLFAVPIVVVMLLLRGRSLLPGRRNVAPLAFLGVLFAVSSLSLFESYCYMGAAIASTLLFVYPLMVAIIMWCFFKEKMSWTTIVSILVAMAGIALLYQGDVKLSMIGSLLVFVSALSYAIYIVYVNHSRLKSLPTLIITLYVLVFGWIVLAAHALYMGRLDIPQSLTDWSFAFCLALFPTAVSLLCTTGAIRDIGSTSAAILGALEPVTAVAVGVAVFGEPFTLRLAIGLVMIVGAVSCVVAGDRTRDALVRFRHLFPSLRRR